MVSDNELSSKFAGLSFTLFLRAKGFALIVATSISLGAFANRVSLRSPQLLIPYKRCESEDCCVS